MKNSKGFTLVEMLAVITLIAVLALVIIPGTEAVIKKTRQNAYEAQINNLIQSAKNWGAQNIKELPKQEGDYIIITLNDLKKTGFIKNEVKDPRVDKCISNETSIKISKDKNNYKYDIYGIVDTYDDNKCDSGSISTYKTLYSEIMKSTQTKNVYEFLMNQMGPGYQEELEMYPKGLFYVGANPNNWVRIKNNLYRIIRLEDESIKVIYEKTCNGNTCTGNGKINENVYYGFGESIENKSLLWETENNKLRNDLDQWYTSLNIDNYTVPLYLQTSYNINYEEAGYYIRGTQLQSNKKTQYSILGMYDYLFAMVGENIESELPITESYLYKENELYSTAISLETNEIGSDEIILYQIKLLKNASEIQYAHSFCFSQMCEPAKIRPLLNVRLNIKVEKGTGTEADPFILVP